MMNADYWNQRWKEGKTGWQTDSVHPDLKALYQKYQLGDRYHFLYPLCGMSLDIDWLFLKGHAVTGIESSAHPIYEVGKRLGIEWTIDEVDGFTRYHFDNLQIFQGDFFDAEKLPLYGVDVCFDRGAYVAISPELRASYASVYKSLEPANIAMILRMSEEQPAQGPPFGFQTHELHQYMKDAYTIEPIDLSSSSDKDPDHMYEKQVFWLSIKD